MHQGEPATASERSADTAGGPPALRLSGLYQSYFGHVAVDHIDLEVPAGSFFGLVGPNGAGKTTTLSMAAGLLRPTGGSAAIFGNDVWTDPVEAKRLIGVLPDSLSMPERLDGYELLMMTGLMHGLDGDTVAKRAKELLEVLELDEAGHRLVIDYSTGMRKKIGLATALLHGPKLLMLDEPFEAVDPVSASTIRVILQRFVAGGGSVVFSSHVMALVERLCDTVAVLAKGRIVADGPLDEVRGAGTLEDRFVELVGGRTRGDEGLSWLAF